MSRSGLPDLARTAKVALWFGGGTLAGGAGSFVVGLEDHPLRHVLPDAINYFQHSGNMLWSGFLATAAVALASSQERRSGTTHSVLKFAGVAAVSGAVVGGAFNAAYETRLGYELVGQHLQLNGGKTQEPWDLAWGTGYTMLLAAGMAGDIRRYDLKHHAAPGANDPLALPPELPGPETPPTLPPPGAFPPSPSGE